MITFGSSEQIHYAVYGNFADFFFIFNVTIGRIKKW